MDTTTSAHIPIDVHVSIGRRVHLFRVRPATVQEAIAITDAVAVMRESEDDEEAQAAWSHVRRTLAAWLPLRMSSMLTGTGADKIQTAQIAISLLSMGTTPEGSKDAEKTKRRAREDGWTDIISEVMSTYRMTYAEAVQLPFIAFIALSVRVRRVHAGHMWRMLQVRSLPHMKDRAAAGKAVDKIARDAGLIDDAPLEDLPEWMTDPDAKEARRREMMDAAIRMKALWNQKAGEA